MPRREVSGVDMITGTGLKDMFFKDYDAVSFISLILYLLTDKEWIEKIWAHRREVELCFVFFVKTGIEMDYARKIMLAGISRVENHLKNVGIEVERERISNVRAGAWKVAYGNVGVNFWLEQREVFGNASKAM